MFWETAPQSQNIQNSDPKFVSSDLVFFWFLAQSHKRIEHHAQEDYAHRISCVKSHVDGGSHKMVDPCKWYQSQQGNMARRDIERKQAEVGKSLGLLAQKPWTPS